jgi:hypothetical protein
LSFIKGEALRAGRREGCYAAGEGRKEKDAEEEQEAEAGRGERKEGREELTRRGEKGGGSYTLNLNFELQPAVESRCSWIESFSFLPSPFSSVCLLPSPFS